MIDMTYTHRFAKSFPDKLDGGILYVSMEFGTAAHSCFCGCGSDVYTRFSPRDWSMKFDGETVSIDPSIGNWSFGCQSHYFLIKGRVISAPRWSRERIETNRAFDREAKGRHYTNDEKNKSEFNSKNLIVSNVLKRVLRWLGITSQ